MDRKIQEQEINVLCKILEGRPYKPVSKISYGSYGEIFKIIGVDNTIQYALKVISKPKMVKEEKLHQAVIQNILLQKLRHSGIVRYFQSIETEKYICHVIELCPFGDLNQLFKKVNKSIEMSFIKQEIMQYYLAQLISALDFLHQQNIIHRDLKLENVLVGSDLNLRLIDFGTAKALQEERIFTKSQLEFLQNIRKSYKDNEQQSNRTMSFVGSANYLSPESISLQYTDKSDIWSLGILIYKICHGKLPFRGQNNFQIFSSIRNHEKQQLELDKSLSPSLQNLIKVCLESNPNQRPTTSELKKHPYFAKVNFQTIFTTKSPVDAKVLKTVDIKLEKNFEKMKFEMKLEKKMLLGNYKPRILKVYPDKSNKKLFMSYWYLEGTSPKNEFELKMGDYTQKISKNEFLVVNGDVKYTFRVKDVKDISQIVADINNIITQHFQM